MLAPSWTHFQIALSLSFPIAAIATFQPFSPISLLVFAFVRVVQDSRKCNQSKSLDTMSDTRSARTARLHLEPPGILGKHKALLKPLKIYAAWWLLQTGDLVASPFFICCFG